MYRLLLPLLSLVFALSVGSLFQSQVSLIVEAPDMVVAGTEFEVKVNVQKGDLESFSRLQQTFPAGLKATSYMSSNADFTFEEKRVRFIWLRMPAQSSFTVVYKMKADERLKGSFTINGKFSYIDQNERKSVNIASLPIIIQPSPNIDPSLIVDINDYEKLVIPYITPAGAGQQMACIRQQPVKDPGGNGYLVHLLVNKEEKQKFAKIEELIPEGYTAENVDPRESIFTVKGDKAKFLWMNLPSDPYFTVTYRLVPKNPDAEAPFMKGKFSYLEGEETVSLDIKQTDFDLASVSAEQLPVVLASAAMPQMAQVVKVPEVKTPVQETRDLVAEEVVKEIKTTRETTKTVTSPPDQSQTKTQAQTSPREKKPSLKELRNNKAYAIEPEDGIYYRVQLAAGHQSVNIPRYFKKYKLDKEVRKETHEGWLKYSVGSFKEYKEARDYRVHIWNTTPIGDAFVSAYNGGIRITVQEALMDANQQWYR